LSGCNRHGRSHFTIYERLHIMAKAGTKSVSATISAESFEAIEEFRWSQRKNLSQIIDTAVSEFITNHNIPLAAPAVPADTDELPVADEKTEKVAAKGK